MPWSLEIHHLDIDSVGDATFIIAINADYNPPIKQVVLIDGGKTAAGNIIAAYCASNNIDAIDVIAITHFDEDHYWGIIWLLKYTSLCNNAKIYDLGEMHDDFKENRNGVFKSKKSNTEYKDYLDLINAKPNVTHVTALVNGFEYANYNRGTGAVVIPPPSIEKDEVVYLDPYWLVGKEIMWGNGLDGLDNREDFVSIPPDDDAPTITCISANQYVLQHDDNVRFVSDINLFDGGKMYNDFRIQEELNNHSKISNERSLGFLVSFNNFRYYVAGDLTSAQEDGHDNRNMLHPEFQPGVMDYLNNWDERARRVLAMKTSHHGSNESSSREFISRMRPSAAFISTGVNNQHNHPGQRTLNVLVGYPRTPILYGDKYRHPPAPPFPPNIPVPCYLTGYQKHVPLSKEVLDGFVAYTAGAHEKNIPGHILLTITEEQSRRPVQGQHYRGILAAATAIANNTETLQPDNLILDEIADKGATIGYASAVARAVNAPAAAAVTALEAIAYVGNDQHGIGVISTALDIILGAAEMEEEDIIKEAVQEAKALDRTSQFSVGMVETIVLAMMMKTADQIIDGAIKAHLNPDAATAAGHAADQVAATVMGGEFDERYIDTAGYAAAAAIGAVQGGASGSQAAAIAAATATQYRINLLSGQMANMVVNIALAAGMARDEAALAGAVTAATMYMGVPIYVGQATYWALRTAGYPIEDAKAAGKQAQESATIQESDLFTVSFQYYDEGKDGPETTHYSHTS